jgi:hypothetical protein
MSLDATLKSAWTTEGVRDRSDPNAAGEEARCDVAAGVAESACDDVKWFVRHGFVKVCVDE